MRVFGTYGLPNPGPLLPIQQDIQPDYQRRSGESVMDFLERIVDSPPRAANDPNMTDQKEINLVASALSVLTRTRVLPGAITLDPNQKGKIVSTRS